jgi:hypothetical protein
MRALEAGRQQLILILACNTDHGSIKIMHQIAHARDTGAATAAATGVAGFVFDPLLNTPRLAASLSTANAVRSPASTFMPDSHGVMRMKSHAAAMKTTAATASAISRRFFAAGDCPGQHNRCANYISGGKN